MAVNWLDEGMVKKIRGVTFSTGVSAQFENTVIHAARGIFNRLLPDVHISTDHKAGSQAGNEVGTINDNERKELMPPENVGEQIASYLLEEIDKGGVVDSSHQGLLFLLCALCEPDVSKVRVGKLSPCGIETLRNIRAFLGVTFDIKPYPATGTVILRWDVDIRTNLGSFHEDLTKH